MGNFAPQTWTPKDDSTKLYIASFSSLSLNDLIDVIQSHFGADISFDNVSISSEYVHTRCINYDLYDPNDYDDYIVIELTK